MVWNQKQPGFEAAERAGRVAVPGPQVDVLASQARWAWPAALREIFRPRGVNLLVADDVEQFVNIIRSRRIHTTIVDTDSEGSAGLATIRVIRRDYPRMPCILLSSSTGQALLDEALRLEVFSVIDKPVDMGILREQLDRLFVRRYSLNIFS